MPWFRFEDRCIRGLRTRSCKSTVFQTHIRNPLCEFPVETFLSGVQNLVTGLACQWAEGFEIYIFEPLAAARAVNIHGQVNGSNKSRLLVPECGRVSVWFVYKWGRHFPKYVVIPSAVGSIETATDLTEEDIQASHSTQTSWDAVDLSSQTLKNSFKYGPRPYSLNFRGKWNDKGKKIDNKRTFCLESRKTAVACILMKFSSLSTLARDSRWTRTRAGNDQHEDSSCVHPWPVFDDNI